MLRLRNGLLGIRSCNSRQYFSKQFVEGYSGLGRFISSESDSWDIPKSRLAAKKVELQAEISTLPEVMAQQRLKEFLEQNASLEPARHEFHSDYLSRGFHKTSSSTPTVIHYDHLLTSEQIKTILDASIATFLLHVESRIAALCGEGFYTIGPCGEELLSAAALAFKPCDTVALHYRHVAVSLARALEQRTKTLEDLILDRARGYVVSKYDPVTGGVHCAIGGGPNDYVVTSTLASQCPPAVGRALGFSLARRLLPHKTQDRPVSFVSLGDGSVHNAHFLTALNLARHARFRRIACPVVFAISDNGISISYKTAGYVKALLDTLSHGQVGVPVFKADGTDAWDIYSKTRQAMDYARRRSSPVILHFLDMPRRFGHAVTDRQHAYRTEDEIRADHERDVVAGIIVRAVDHGVYSLEEIHRRYQDIHKMVVNSLEVAAEEPKNNNRACMVRRVAAPLVELETKSVLCQDLYEYNMFSEAGKREVMRKHMTRVIDESLSDHPELVYIGEDVEHGGYYLVTDGLARKYPRRIIDFPPDETSLIGTAIGYAQLGLTPIVELPYAKYLDCGADMMFEAALSYWLTNGSRPNGMVVRLQGWGEGKFGGNFHTHNALHIPPGIDVVCYSNGGDYVRGFRHAVRQAKGGRIVMLVDSTNLLNLRHLYGKDRAWERAYPENNTDLMGFDSVTRYRHGNHHPGKPNVLIVTFGNGVVAVLQAINDMKYSRYFGVVDVVDCPLLSAIPEGLRTIVDEYSHILFADVCKEGQNPLSAMAVQLQSERLLSLNWKLIAAVKTYNPLGSTTTFLSKEDIIDALKQWEK